MSRKVVLVLRHVDCEHPGTFTPALAEAAELRTVRMGVDPVPETLDGVDALVVMGGPMGVGDAAGLPWLARELELVAAAVRQGLPVWGVCLGAQVLAAAAGAAVYPAAAPEVGVRTLRVLPVAAGDPVWSGLDERTPVLQWHGDTFDLPAGAVALATGDDCPQQLFRLGRSYGMQFHLEVTGEMVDEWLGIDAYADALRSVYGDDGPRVVREQVREAAEPMRAAADRAARAWMAGWA